MLKFNDSDDLPFETKSFQTNGVNPCQLQTKSVNKTRCFVVEINSFFKPISLRKWRAIS